MPEKPPESGNNKNKPVPRREYDGVIYEPSSYARSRPPQKNTRPPVTRKPAATTARRESPRPRSRTQAKKTKPKFAIFYILTLLTGVTVCVVLFMMAYTTMTKDNPAIEGTINTPPSVQGSAALENEGKEQRTVTGLITTLDITVNPRVITLLELENGRSETYTVTDATQIKNRYGTQIAFTELSVGRIVDAGYEVKTKALSVMTESAQAWEYKYKNNVKIDTEQSTLTIGNDIYSFGNQTLVLYEDKPYPIGHITDVDTVSVTGYQNRAWCVRVESNHGFLRIENADTIVNGTLSVDTSIYRGLEETEVPVSLAEGTHRVVIEGQNIEPYIADVVIKPGETTIVSLVDVEMKKAVLHVNVSIPDCAIIIDGETAAENGTASLTFGDHTVRVEKDGYIPVQQDVTLSKSYTEISVELEAIPKNGRLIVISTPSQAEIFVDNAFVGYSTLTFSVETGTHTVIARKNGYNDSVITVTVNEGDNPYYLQLTEHVDDVFSNLPALPEGTQPIQNP